MSAVHPPTSPRQPSQAEFLHLLNDTARGQVQVIAAPPGSGKSTAMYAAVAAQVAEQERTRPGQPYRVVWATHSIHGDKPLGQEAMEGLEQALRSAGSTSGVKLLKGERHFTSNKEYRAQFNWPPDVAVHVVSHAHLPLLLASAAGSHFERFMRGVELVIIDEDPLGALVYSLGADVEGITPAWLQWPDPAMPPGSVGEALATIMERVLTGAIPAWHIERTERLVSQRVECNLSGEHFWSHFLAALDGRMPDWEAFRATLNAAVRQKNENAIVPAEVVDEMRAEYGQALLGLQNSPRFGLTWERGLPTTLRFRADVLRVIPAATPPIVVLDAYADPAVGQYQAMFPRHQVDFDTDWRSVPLDVEVIPELHVDRNNLIKKKQPMRRDHMMAEVGQLAAAHRAGAVVLSYRSVTEFLSREEFAGHWTARPGVTLPPPDPKGRKSIEFAYWFAGRGVNTYEGQHVVALHPPERPSVVEHHQMAALAPNEPRQRTALAEHLRRTELLQMLHRGRQVNFEEGDPQRPRVIVAFDLHEFDRQLGASSWVTVRQAPLSKPFRVSSENPYHVHAVQRLSLELLQLYGAVPQVCLVALGLYTARSTEKEAVPRARSALKRRTRHAKRKAPLLSTWSGSLQPLYDELGAYEAATGERTDRVLAVFKAHARLAHLETHNVRLPTRLGSRKTRVYAADDAAAEQAIRELFGSG